MSNRTSFMNTSGQWLALSCFRKHMFFLDTETLPMMLRSHSGCCKLGTPPASTARRCRVRSRRRRMRCFTIASQARWARGEAQGLSVWFQEGLHRDLLHRWMRPCCVSLQRRSRHVERCWFVPTTDISFQRASRTPSRGFRTLTLASRKLPGHPPGLPNTCCFQRASENASGTIRGQGVNPMLGALMQRKQCQVVSGMSAYNTLHHCIEHNMYVCIESIEAHRKYFIVDVPSRARVPLHIRYSMLNSHTREHMQCIPHNNVGLAKQKPGARDERRS